MKRGALRRRDLLVQTGGFMAGIAAAPAMAEAHGSAGDVKAFPVPDGPGPPSDDYVIGTIERSDGDAALWLRVADGSLVTVRAAPGAAVFRGGRVGLSAFPIGEEVVAHGKLSAGSLTATDVLSLMRGVDGHVEARTGNHVRVGGSTFEITSETRSAEATGHGREQGSAAPNIEVGDHILGSFRSNHATNVRTLLVLGRLGG